MFADWKFVLLNLNQAWSGCRLEHFSNFYHVCCLENPSGFYLTDCLDTQIFREKKCKAHKEQQSRSIMINWWWWLLCMMLLMYDAQNSKVLYTFRTWEFQYLSTALPVPPSVSLKKREREREQISPHKDPPLSLFNYLREAPFSKFAILLTSLLSVSDAFTLIRFLTASTISISSVPMSPWDRIFSLRLSDWTQSSTHQR